MLKVQNQKLTFSRYIHRFAESWEMGNQTWIFSFLVVDPPFLLHLFPSPRVQRSSCLIPCAIVKSSVGLPTKVASKQKRALSSTSRRASNNATLRQPVSSHARNSKYCAAALTENSTPKKLTIATASPRVTSAIRT